ncbi:aldo/keto reductase [Sandarakinorhabdus cyanobacteriorum]|uniref:Aldo/keto reductase n=1 Tax=Sandarakinorhabdus cyanobacteriorum TaxID=1981098 RepID=A0A255YGX1_9SPHN|nr:aldo/keto reductase [Sandarakinorhabdus cyanobacteriorum]OYQ27815.1 aldo/keto reductase [Sandarakinorhabdus cyanobacteriorum]
MSIERTLLAPGHAISRLIRGGWQLAGDHGPVDRASLNDGFLAGYDAGITTLDCADIYTGVEAMIGDFRRHLAQARGAEALARLKVHTKFVPDLDGLAHLSFADVEAIIDRSRARLGMERLDLVQFHWWDYGLGDPVAALHHLARLRADGRIAHIAGTNFDAAHLAQFAAAGVPLASIQVQYSLLDRRPAGAFAATAAASGTGLLCYGTLAGGFLSARWLGQPDPAAILTNRSLIKYRLIIDECGGWDAFQGLLETLGAIAASHDVPLSAVAARWVLDQPQVAAIIIGARDASHLADTLAIATVRLSPADHARIAAALPAGPQGDVYALERDRTGRHGRIMKYGLNKG